jgi:hypothetical protein
VDAEHRTIGEVVQVVLPSQGKKAKRAPGQQSVRGEILRQSSQNDNVSDKQRKDSDMPDKRPNRNKSKFNYGSYFREMRDTQDLTTKPEDVSWTLTVPFEADAEPHDVVLYLGCNVLAPPT